MGFAINQVTDNYEFLGIIDKPKVGVTYKVRNLSTGEFEALRTLPGTTSRDSESAERLLREIRIQARLSHPNIIAFHDAFEIDGHLVMTTELVEGRTLSDLCQKGFLTPSQAIGTIIHLLDGLEEAHALGIVHRGITAGHVVFSQGGAVKLGGFGLAKPASDTSLTLVGAVVGDPRYISPEQVTGLGAIDSRSDLYSVGVLLYQTLTGKMPFAGANDFEVLAAQVRSEPQPPSALNPAISPELDRIALKALKKSPGERYQDAKEFRAALASAAEYATLPAPPPGKGLQDVPPPSFGQEAPKRSFSTRLVFAAVVLIIGLAIVGWLAMR